MSLEWLNVRYVGVVNWRAGLFLQHHDELLVRLAQTAEACCLRDSNTTLIKMRQLGEELVRTIASRVDLIVAPSKSIY